MGTIASIIIGLSFWAVWWGIFCNEGKGDEGPSEKVQMWAAAGLFVLATFAGMPFIEG